MKSRKLNLSSILKNNLLDSEGLIKKLEKKGIEYIIGSRTIGKIKFRMKFELGIEGQIIIYYLDEFSDNVWATIKESYKKFLNAEKNSRFYIKSIKFKGKEYTKQ